MLVRGVRLQIFFVARLPGDLKNAVFLGSFDVCAVPVVPGQIVVHDMANFVQRRCLKENLRLFLQKVCRHVEDE